MAEIRLAKATGFNLGSITANAPFDITETWNNAAVTFTAFKVSVTNTLSNSASKLADLQAGGVSMLTVDLNSTALNTRISVYDVDNAQLERVSVGAADSGGSGFKVLRIAN